MTLRDEMYAIGALDDPHTYTPSAAEMLDAWTAYTARGQGIPGRDRALGEYLRFMHRTRQEGRQ